MKRTWTLEEIERELAAPRPPDLPNCRSALPPGSFGAERERAEREYWESIRELTALLAGPIAKAVEIEKEMVQLRLLTNWSDDQIAALPECRAGDVEGLKRLVVKAMSGELDN